MQRPSMQIALGIVLGAGVGTALGIAAGHVAAWLGIGIAIGVVIGSNFRSTNCAECAEVNEKHQARSQQPEARG
jgi:predicted lysophospholipase L1 biosynthesis ABC-type transport system permease subunit